MKEQRSGDASQAHEPIPDPTTPLEAIKRLCALIYEVHDTAFEWGDGPCDCFCPDREGDPQLWRSTGDALRFAERTVREALRQRVGFDGVEIDAEDGRRICIMVSKERWKAFEAWEKEHRTEPATPAGPWLAIGRNLYCGNDLVGMVDSAELATAIVEAMNWRWNEPQYRAAQSSGGGRKEGPI